MSGMSFVGAQSMGHLKARSLPVSGQKITLLVLSPAMVLGKCQDSLMFPVTIKWVFEGKVVIAALDWSSHFGSGTNWHCVNC